MGRLSPTAPAFVQSYHPVLSANLQPPSGLLLFFLLGSNPVSMWQPELSLERCKSCHSLLKALQWLSPLGFKKNPDSLPWSSRPSLLWPMPAKVISDRNALSLLLDFSHPIPVPRRLLACPVRQSACVALSPLLYAFLSQRSLLYITSQRGPLTTPFNVTSFSRSFFVCHLGCFQQCINQKLVVQSLSHVQLSVTP